jgi:hypothetical protein
MSNPVGTYRRRQQGTYQRRSDGTYGRVTADADCGCAGCSCINLMPAFLDVVRADGKHYGGNLRWSFEGEPAGQNWERPMNRGGLIHRDCSRLLVYEGVKIVGNAIDPSVSGMLPLYAMKTNGAGANYGAFVGGVPLPVPFKTGFTPSPGPDVPGVPSGADLDTEPYWYATCQLGGWEDVTSSHWYKPTIDYIDARRDATSFAGTLENGTYRYLLVTANFQQHFANGAVAIPYNRGRVALSYWRAERTG